MNRIQAVSKHDGRVVAFKSEALVASIAAAALSSGERSTSLEARDFAVEMAAAIAEFVIRECSATPSTVDIREMTLRLLRETDHNITAHAFERFARQATAYLFALSVANEQNLAGEHWDRRRLIEALRGSQIARDPAGEVAREVERRLIRLGLEVVSCELIHALAKGILMERRLDARCFSARSISVSLVEQVPQYVPVAASSCVLPSAGPALKSFWLQAIHSNEVAIAIKANALGLEPYPSSPDDESAMCASELLNPLRSEDVAAFQNALSCRPVSLKANDEIRLSAVGGEGDKSFFVWADMLAQAGSAPGDPSVEDRPKPHLSNLPNVLIQSQVSSEKSSGAQARMAPAITLNVGGVLKREAIRDVQGATLRLSQLVKIAALAHREREEYWGFSAARGRRLPVVLAGLWNAAAWLCGDSYEQTEPLLNLRLSAGAILSGLALAFKKTRDEMGLNLVLQDRAPESAASVLWHQDRIHFAKDGWVLDPDAVYQIGLGMTVRAGMAEFQERVDFFKSVRLHFDQKPGLLVEIPFGLEAEVGVWRELMTVLKQLDVPCIRLQSGGSRRGLRLLIRQLKEHIEGFPLFECTHKD